VGDALQYQSVSLTKEARAALAALRDDLTRCGTGALPRVLAPPTDLTLSEVVLLGVRAVRLAMK
jgi:hypothetical protein